MTVTPLYEFDDEMRQRIVKMHLEMPRGGEVTGPIEGAYGEVYSINLSNSPLRIAAKCPRIKRFGTLEKARVGIEEVLHELEKAHSVFMVPWVNRFFDVQFIHGWPFLLSRYRHGTLEDLIDNPLAWSMQDKLATLIQIVRALRLARERGISSHQDLKPGNIFFDDLRRRFEGVEGSKGIHFHMYVGDFGLADAFRDFGRAGGSRPYMAPEQFSADPLPRNASDLFDVFALGVIAFECFTDGQHPIGVHTSDVWPWRQGIPQRWNRESTWRDWASKRDKSLSVTGDALPVGMTESIHSALASEPSNRPSLEEFENRLWDTLLRLDNDTYAGVRMQVDYLEGLSSGDDEWPHMDERLTQLRRFYSGL